MTRYFPTQLGKKTHTIANLDSKDSKFSQRLRVLPILEATLDQNHSRFLWHQNIPHPPLLYLLRGTFMIGPSAAKSLSRYQALSTLLSYRPSPSRQIPSLGALSLLLSAGIAIDSRISPPMLEKVLDAVLAAERHITLGTLFGAGLSISAFCSSWRNQEGGCRSEDAFVGGACRTYQSWRSSHEEFD